MAQLSDRLNRLAPSATLAMSQKSNEMKAQGVDVINMSVGEPDFNTPENIKEAAKKAIDDNFSRYSPVPGYPDLRKAIVAKLKNENGLDYTANEVIVGTGGKQGICNVILALVNPGDEVIIPAPYWVSYPQMVKLAGGVPVTVSAGFEQDFKMTAEQLENAITDKTKMLILCSPSNPTGSVYSKEELASLAEVLRKHPDVFVLADEIYEHINYVGKHHSIAQEPGLKEQVIIANGVSTAYAMTGWRIGYTGSSKEIAKMMGSVQSHQTSNPNSIAQKAAVEALTGPQDSVALMHDEFDKRRKYMYERICKMPLVSTIEPMGAFYVFVDASEVLDKSYKGEKVGSVAKMAEILINEYNTAVVPCADFGFENHLRLSYAISIEQIEKGLDRIESFLNELK